MPRSCSRRPPRPNFAFAHGLRLERPGAHLLRLAHRLPKRGQGTARALLVMPRESFAEERPYPCLRATQQDR